MQARAAHRWEWENRITRACCIADYNTVQFNCTQQKNGAMYEVTYFMHRVRLQDIERSIKKNRIGRIPVQKKIVSGEDGRVPLILTLQ